MSGWLCRVRYTGDLACYLAPQDQVLWSCQHGVVVLTAPGRVLTRPWAWAVATTR